ncbi:hypothetical protein PM082_014582 [Marasmius tenuissimus]|nr:hypothetical protein PM082_014582 [Marasmius tenuissimus]
MSPIPVRRGLYPSDGDLYHKFEQEIQWRVGRYPVYSVLQDQAAAFLRSRCYELWRLDRRMQSYNSSCWNRGLVRTLRCGSHLLSLRDRDGRPRRVQLYGVVQLRGES